MILSHRHQFIFLHARKTAGSSMSVEMARRLGDDDIMVGCWADALRSGVQPNRAALSAAREVRSRSIGDRLRRSRNSDPDAFNGAVKTYYREHYFLDAAAHSSAERVRAMAGDLWPQAFKFVS